MDFQTVWWEFRDGIKHAHTATMLVLKGTQRQVLVDKVPDVANVAIGALSFGQFLGDRPFSLTLALSGAAIWVILMALSIVLANERNDS
jgi:hypothetical protein